MNQTPLPLGSASTRTVYFPASRGGRAQDGFSVNLKTVDIGGPVAYADHGGTGPPMVGGEATGINRMPVVQSVIPRQIAHTPAIFQPSQPRPNPPLPSLFPTRHYHQARPPATPRATQPR